MLMYIVIIVGILAIAYLGYKNWRGRRGERFLTNALSGAYAEMDAMQKRIFLQIDDIHAMEVGREEQEENYEMQFLTFREMIQEKDDHIQELEARLEMHDRECLPILQETRWQALQGGVENA